MTQYCVAQQYTATHCNTLQHTATHWSTYSYVALCFQFSKIGNIRHIVVTILQCSALSPFSMEIVDTISTENALWIQFPLRMLHPWNTPNRETQIPQDKFKWDQDLSLNLYCEILRNPSFSIWWISGTRHFQWKLSRFLRETRRETLTENVSTSFVYLYAYITYIYIYIHMHIYIYTHVYP